MSGIAPKQQAARRGALQIRAWQLVRRKKACRSSKGGKHSQNDCCFRLEKKTNYVLTCLLELLHRQLSRPDAVGCSRWLQATPDKPDSLAAPEGT